MTLGWLITQIALYVVSFVIFFLMKNKNIIVLIIGTLINIVISFCIGWCIITTICTLESIAFIFIFISIELDWDICFIISFLSALLAIVLPIGFEIQNNINGVKKILNKIEYVQEQRIDIFSSSDKGIADTTINGTSNLLFGTVSGTTTLKYYYGYYYQASDGSLHIGTIPSNLTNLYLLVEGEQPHIIVKTNYHKIISRWTGLQTKKVYPKFTYYELYVPQSAIPTNFTYDLN